MREERTQGLIDASQPKRLLLLTTTTGYQTRAFIETANKLDLGIVLGTDRCHVLEDPWQDGALPLRFEDPEGSARHIVEYAGRNLVHAVVCVGDRPTPTAALACARLGLLHHPLRAAESCRDKYLSRERLRAAGLDMPSFNRFPVAMDPGTILRMDPTIVHFPCVLKPLALAAGRGVIRADNPREFVTAFERIKALLLRPEVRVMREETSNFIQVEEYVEGEEIAVEAVVDRGRFRVLAIFDKPDPLVGPFFEETIYVTPSRLKPEVQGAVIKTLEQAVKAFGLYHGPLHAELRVESGEVTHTSGRVKHIWILEVAARSIGGLCSRALRFCPRPPGESFSLEEVVIRLALGEDISAVERESVASGVMMIPIPGAGLYQEVKGMEEARQTPGIKEIIIAAKPAQQLEPLPEGSSYLGFIFACGPSPELVEKALRRAHQQLYFVIAPALPVIQTAS